jgi:hypothetical protein
MRADGALVSRLPVPFSDGLALAVGSPVRGWRGEGDERVWVDGGPFPSVYGTGTEGYFGFAWCSPEAFEHPYRAQPRCDGPLDLGHTRCLRWQVPDTIPFQRRLRFDLEPLHWGDARLDLATTAWWYGPAREAAPVLPPVERRLRDRCLPRTSSASPTRSRRRPCRSWSAPAGRRARRTCGGSACLGAARPSSGGRAAAPATG